MAAALDAKTTANATSAGLTVSHTTSATADFMTVKLGVRGNQTATMTYAGVSLTQDVTEVDTADPERVAIFSLVAPATGANNLIVSLSGSVLHFVSIATWEVDSPPLTLVATGNNSNEGASSEPNVTVGAGAGALGVDCASSEVNVSPPFSTNGADQTVLHNVGTGSYGIGTSYELAPASGEVWNWGYGAPDTPTWCHVAAIYAESGAAATYPTASLDYVRGAFPLLPMTADRVKGPTGRPGRKRWKTGPAPAGGFERFIFPRLHAVYEVGGTTFDQAVDATVNVTATVTNQVGKFVSATVTTAAAISRQVGKPLADTITTAATLVRQIAKPISATVTTSTTLGALRVFLRTLSATVTTSPTLQRVVGKPVAATVTTATTLTRRVGKTISATVTTSTTLGALKVILKNLSATVTTSATVQRLTSFHLSATVTTTASVAKQVAKTIAATVTTVASLIATFVSGAAGAASLVFFGRSRPRGGLDQGTPAASEFDDGTPGGSLKSGSPEGDFYE